MEDSPSVQFKLNIPITLKDKLSEAAERSGRSMTAEINTRLAASFEADEEMANALDNIDDLMIRVEKLERMVRSHDERLNPLDHDDD